MAGFRRSSSNEHIVHALELPELLRRRPRGTGRAQGGRRGDAGEGQRPPAELRLTHGHRPEDGVPLRVVDIPRPAAAPAMPLAPTPTVPPAAVPEHSAPARGSNPVDAARIELLERRLAKLSRALEDRTAQLQLRMDRGSAEAGVASVYASVQGLRGESEEVQRKRGLMAAIFEANRKLRERVGSGSADAE